MTDPPDGARIPVALVGDGAAVPCITGETRPYTNLDAAASTAALPTVAGRVNDFLPWYSSVHRGAGYKSRLSTNEYEAARTAALAFAGRATDSSDVAIFCRNTTEAIIIWSTGSDSTQTTSWSPLVEHHANLLPRARVCKRRFVECGPDGTFTVDDVTAQLDAAPRPRLLTVTAASNVTGWLPPIDELIDAAHARSIPVLVDAAHRRLPERADYLAWSGHKMYAPFGGGVLIGPRDTFADGDPFLAGGGAVDLVDLDEVVWTDPPDREEAGSPNVIGAVALHAAIDALTSIGWPDIAAHDDRLAKRLRHGLAGIDEVRLLGPNRSVPTLPIATFVVEGVPHALIAARLSAEYAIGVRHGCFCAHPYLTRLLGLSDDRVAAYQRALRAGDRTQIPGAVRASCGITTTPDDIDRLLAAVTEIAHTPPPVPYLQDPTTGDYWPQSDMPGWSRPDSNPGAPCSRG